MGYDTLSRCVWEPTMKLKAAYPPKRLSPFIELHGIRSQETVIFMLTTRRVIKYSP
jgi:hypothetical protein